MEWGSLTFKTIPYPYSSVLVISNHSQAAESRGLGDFGAAVREAVSCESLSLRLWEPTVHWQGACLYFGDNLSEYMELAVVDEGSAFEGSAFEDMVEGQKGMAAPEESAIVVDGANGA
jgi:hypothetical protein